MGDTGTVQEVANNLVDAAQQVANQGVDLGEEGVKVVVGAVITSLDLLSTTLKSLESHLLG